MNNLNLVAEIGINHNGDLKNIEKLIDIASCAGFNYVKFQKRNPEKCVPKTQKNKKKSTPWGEMTYLEYKKRIELGEKDYKWINEYCDTKGIDWFASAWDLDSAIFIKNMDKKIIKIPSAKITDLDLLTYCRKNFEFMIISTGMSCQKEIDMAILSCNPDVIMHSIAIYPTDKNDINLKYISYLKDKYDIALGYSGHEKEIYFSFAAVAYGATWIEKHITLDNDMWGSDQKMSLNPEQVFSLGKKIKNIYKALQKGYEPRKILEEEKIKRRQLRG
jgi:N-acetylneuraminate synthase